MIKRLSCALALLVFMSVKVGAVELYTEDFPPYNYMKNGELVGIGPDIIRALAKEAGEDPKITVLPWVRAYKYAQEKKEHGYLLDCEDAEKGARLPMGRAALYGEGWALHHKQQ